MIGHLVRALPAALAAGILPGYYWAVVIRRCRGLGERLAYSAVLSMGSVPAVALALSWILGSGVTLVVAIASILIVFGSGLLAYRLNGPAGGPAGPALPAPRPVRDGRVLALVIVATGLAMAAAVSWPVPGWLLVAVLVVTVAAGLLAAFGRRREPAAAEPGGTAGPAVPPEPTGASSPGGSPAGEPPAGTAGPRWGWRRAWPEWVLAAILALAAIRSYLGVAWHDWPFLRGQDMFSHAVMTEQMLAHGHYSSYLIYPPGLSTFSAVVCRLCGLPPLPMFAAAAPTLLVLTTLAFYALATRLWGRNFGLIAAALAGLVLVGPYVSFSGGLYPDLLAAFFFMIMTVAALVTFFQSPTIRSGILLTVTAGAVVLYHSVGTEYLLVLLAATAVACLPYLFSRGPVGRDLGRALIIGLAAIGFLSVIYAWRTYGLGELTGRGATTRDQVGLDVGSQPVLKAGDVLNWVGAPIIWAGIFGFILLLAMVVRRRLRQPGQVASALTVLAWAVVMYAGSRTTADGFPQRYERDVGAPLTILATLGLGVILMSLVQLWRARRAAARLADAQRAGAERAGLVVAGPVVADPVPAGPVPATEWADVVPATTELAATELAATELAATELASTGPVAAGALLRRARLNGDRPATPAGGETESAGAGRAAAHEAGGAATATSAGSAADRTATATSAGSAADRTATATSAGSAADRTTTATSAGSAAGSGTTAGPGTGGGPAHPALEPARARSGKSRWAAVRPVLAVAAAAAVLGACMVQTSSNMVNDSERSREVLLPGVAAAGAWLRQHNTGGNIISTPNLNRGVTNRAVLAMGGYTGLQAYPLAKIIHPRSLPTAGRKPLLDSRMVLLYPADCQSARILSADDIRYIFLYRFGGEANFQAFAASPDWYRLVFSDRDVLIYQPVRGASC